MCGLSATQTDDAKVEPENPAFSIASGPFSTRSSDLWLEPYDYTDFHKIFVLILCAPVVLYANIPAVSGKYNYRWCLENIGYPIPEKIKNMGGRSLN